MASAGNGSPQHLYGELFKAMTGVALVHVPYRAYPSALADLIGGRVQVMFDALASSLPHIRAGRLRALALTATARSPALPEIPTVANPARLCGERLAGARASLGTPVEIIDTLNREIAAALADPGMTARIADLGGTPLPGSAADFAKLIADDTAKWGEVISRAGLKVE